MTGAVFAEARKRMGLSQSDLAAELSVERRTIGRIEAMDTVPVLYERAMRDLTAMRSSETAH